MTEIDIILTILNHPLTWIGIISIPVIILGKHFFKSQLEVFKAKTKAGKDKEYKLNSVAGKVQFAIENTDIAYKKLSDDIKENRSNMIKTSEPNAKKVFESKMKSAETQLKIVQKIMEHKDVVDMFAPIAIPAIEKIEKGIMSKIKGGFNF